MAGVSFTTTRPSATEAATAATAATATARPAEATASSTAPRRAYSWASVRLPGGPADHKCGFFKVSRCFDPYPGKLSKSLRRFARKNHAESTIQAPPPPPSYFVFPAGDHTRFGPIRLLGQMSVGLRLCSPTAASGTPSRVAPPCLRCLNKLQTPGILQG